MDRVRDLLTDVGLAAAEPVEPSGDSAKLELSSRQTRIFEIVTATYPSEITREDMAGPDEHPPAPRVVWRGPRAARRPPADRQQPGVRAGAGLPVRGGGGIDVTLVPAYRTRFVDRLNHAGVRRGAGDPTVGLRSVISESQHSAAGPGRREPRFPGHFQAPARQLTPSARERAQRQSLSCDAPPQFVPAAVHLPSDAVHV